MMHHQAHGNLRASLNRQVVTLVILIISGLAAAAGLQHRINALPPPKAKQLALEQLYVSPEAARSFVVPAFRGLVADWYWLRVLQYVGGKMASHTGSINIDNLRPLNLKLLAPLLEATTTLDNRFMAAYEYGAVVLPAVEPEAAVKLVNKGIAANPQAWRLYHHLGYIHWQQRRFQQASEAYAKGAELPGAPAWMRILAARMAAHGGSREVAREIFTRLYEQADDESIKEVARSRLLQLRSLDEQIAIHRLMLRYRQSTGRCPSAWSEVSGALRTLKFNIDSSGAPLDPLGTPYVLMKDICGVRLNPNSKLPRR